MENYNDNFMEIEGAKISIIGVGGGGGNAIRLMKNNNIEGVKYIAINTDSQHLERKTNADIKIPIGRLGAGANPEIGRKAAEENRNEIKKYLQGQDMIFITAGMGGGTGTGASPVVASIAKELGVLTVAIVTKPFNVEGKTRNNNATQGIAELKKYVDTLIVVPNQRLYEIDSKNRLAKDMFEAPNYVLLKAVKGITEVITKDGMINIDFADIRTIMKDSGEAVISFGEAKEGEDVLMAVESAVKNPLLERTLKGAQKILLNITMSQDSPFSDFQEISDKIKEYSGLEDTDVMMGIVFDDESKDTRITLVGTSFVEEDTVVNEVIQKTETATESEDGKVYNDDNNSIFLPPFED